MSNEPTLNGPLADPAVWDWMLWEHVDVGLVFLAGYLLLAESAAWACKRYGARWEARRISPEEPLWSLVGIALFGLWGACMIWCLYWAHHQWGRVNLGLYHNLWHRALGTNGPTYFADLKTVQNRAQAYLEAPSVR